MGLLTNSGCLSRILGPICISTLYYRFGTLYTMLFTLVIMLIPMIWLILLKDRLHIDEFKHKSPDMEECKDKTVEME